MLSSIGSVATAQTDLFAEYAYVPNEKTDDVSVINTTTNTVISRIPVGNNPVGVAVNLDGTRVYVTNSGDDIDRGYTFSIIYTDTDEVTSKLVYAGEGVKPFGVAITPDETLYIASYVTGKVYAINLSADYSTPINVGNHPVGVAITPDGKNVYVANRGSNSVSVINTTTNTVTATVDVGREPYGVAVSSDGRVYVTNQNSSDVSVINTTTDKVTTTVNVGVNPHGVAVTPNGKWVYVTTFSNVSDPGSVYVINTTTNKVTGGPISVGILPSGLGQFIGSVQDSRIETVTTLVSPPNKYPDMESTTLIAIVNATFEGTGNPSGTIAFMDGTTTIGTGTLRSGQAILDASSFSKDSHSISARYMGNDNFRPSTSSSFTLAVKEPPNETITSTPSFKETLLNRILNLIGEFFNEIIITVCGGIILAIIKKKYFP